MFSSRLPRHFVLGASVAVAALTLAGCRDSQQEPAGQAIAEVEAALADAGGDPAKYAPGDLNAVETKLDDLKRDYASGEYAAVVRDAPAVLAEVRGLQGRAVTRVREVTQTLESQWSSLAGAVPAAIESARQATKGGGADEGSSSTSSPQPDDASALWQRAVVEHDAGHLAQAVTLGHQALELAQRSP